MTRKVLLSGVLATAAFALVLSPAPMQGQGACSVCIAVEEIDEAPGSATAAGRAPTSTEERQALEASLVALGFQTIVTDDPASAGCVAAVAYPGCGSCDTTPDLAWVQGGGGYVQVSDWGRDYQANDWNSIVEGSPVEVTIVDGSHPITQGLPSQWTTLGFWRYGFSEEDYYGWVSDPDPDLAAVEGAGRALSARTEGTGRLAYIGWNVYGPEATPEDLVILDRTVRWAGGCALQQPPIQEIPTLSIAALAGLALLLGAAALFALRR